VLLCVRGRRIAVLCSRGRLSAVLHEILVFEIIIELASVERSVISIVVTNNIMFFAMFTSDYITRLICA
jgi:hypothetical protein